MVARNLGNLQEGIAKAREAWKAMASRGLALSLEPMSGLAAAISKERPALSGEVGGAAIEVRVRSDIVHYGWTDVTGKRAGTGHTVGVHPNPGGVFGYLRSWLGQDIQIGDEAFDPAYLITGKPEEAAKAVLTPGVRELVVALGTKLAGFTIDEDGVRVVLHGVETDEALLGAAIDLAAAGAAWKG